MTDLFIIPIGQASVCLHVLMLTRSEVPNTSILVTLARLEKLESHAAIEAHGGEGGSLSRYLGNFAAINIFFESSDLNRDCSATISNQICTACGRF